MVCIPARRRLTSAPGGLSALSSIRARLPSRTDNVFEQAGAGQQMSAAVIHDAEVARIVQMQIEVDVVRPHAHAQRIFAENVERREGINVLADGQGRNADEAGEMGQGGLPNSSVVESARASKRPHAKWTAERKRQAWAGAQDLSTDGRMMENGLRHDIFLPP